MPTNADAVSDFEAAKNALEKQVPAATGTTADKLLLAVQSIADEVGALETVLLTHAYVPQTDAFKAATNDGKTFVASLNSLKQALVVVAGLAQILDRMISYIKGHNDADWRQRQGDRDAVSIASASSCPRRRDGKIVAVAGYNLAGLRQTGHPPPRNPTNGKCPISMGV